MDLQSEAHDRSMNTSNLRLVHSVLLLIPLSGAGVATPAQDSGPVCTGCRDTSSYQETLGSVDGWTVETSLTRYHGACFDTEPYNREQ